MITDPTNERTVPNSKNSLDTKLLTAKHRHIDKSRPLDKKLEYQSSKKQTGLFLNQRENTTKTTETTAKHLKTVTKILQKPDLGTSNAPKHSKNNGSSPTSNILDSSKHNIPSPTSDKIDSSKDEHGSREQSMVTPTKYKFLKVQMSRGHRVTCSSTKVQMSRDHCVTCSSIKVKMSHDPHMTYSSSKVQIHSQIPQNMNNTQPTHGLHSSIKVQISPKYKFHKVQMSRDHHVNSCSTKVQISPTKYTFLKVQMSRDRHVNSNPNKIRTHSQTPQRTNLMQPVHDNQSSINIQKDTKHRKGRQKKPSKKNLITYDCNRRQNRSFYYYMGCLLYTSPSPRDRQKSRMPSSA